MTALATIAIVVYQHASDAAFYWQFRDEGSRSPEFDLDELAHGDGLLEANLEGLRVNGEAGWRQALAELARWRMPGEAFVCAVLAFDRAGTRWDELLASIEDATETFAGLIDACRWLPWSCVAASASAWLDSPDPRLRRLAVAAHSFHRHSLGEAFDALSHDPDPHLRAQVLLHAGQTGDRDASWRLHAALDDTEPACRTAAACALALLGDDHGLPRLLEALRQSQATPLALTILGLRLSAPEIDSLIGEDDLRPELRIALIRAAGATRWIPRLIDWVRDPAIAAAAASAFMHLTGAEREALAAEPAQANPSPDDPNPTQAGDLAAADAAVDSDDEETDDEGDGWHPDPDAFAAWWNTHRGRLSEPRLLSGHASDPEAWQALLRDGQQPARQYAAWALALHRPGSGVFDVAAPAPRQWAALNAPTPG